MLDPYLTPEAYEAADESTRALYGETPSDLGVHVLGVKPSALNVTGDDGRTRKVELALQDIHGLTSALEEEKEKRRRATERLSKIPEDLDIGKLQKDSQAYARLKEDLDKKGESITKAEHDSALEDLRSAYQKEVESEKAMTASARKYVERSMIADPIRALFEGEKPKFRGNPERLLDYIQARDLMEVVWEDGVPSPRVRSSAGSGHRVSRQQTDGGSTYMGPEEFVGILFNDETISGIFERGGVEGPGGKSPNSRTTSNEPNPFHPDSLNLSGQAAYLKKYGRAAYEEQRKKYGLGAQTRVAAR